MSLQGIKIFDRWVSWWWVLTFAVFFSVLFVNTREVPPKPEPVSVWCVCCESYEHICCKNNECDGR